MKYTIYLLAAILEIALLTNTVRAGQPRPNILWITCEDISPNLGCYGDEFAITPNLDRLAEQGVRYTNAFGICGVCAVNRSCLATGVYSCALGSHGMRSRITLPEKIKCASEYLRKAGYYCTNNSKTDYNFAVPKDAWDVCSGKGHWRGRKAGQPFFAIFNFTCSHESQIRCSEARYEQHMKGLPTQWRHDPAKVPLPPFHPDVPKVRKDWARYHDIITSMDHKAGEILKQLEEDGLADDTIVFFYSDHGAGMPRCKKWIYDCGTHVPLIVRFPEKYKDLAPGKPGTATDRLVSFVDFAPTVLSLVGLAIPEYMQGHAFLGKKAGKPREYVHLMRSRMAERYELVRGTRDKRYLYLRNYMPHLTRDQHISYTYQMPTMQVWHRMAEEGKLKGPQRDWFSPTKPLEELYDCRQDPWNLNNLAGQQKMKPVLQRMREEHLRFEREIRDLAFTPEYDMALRSKGGAEYDMRLDPKKHPFERIHAAAELTGRGERELPKLIGLLGDDAPAVRWWACVALTAMKQKAKPAEAALKKAIKDKSVVVRIAAADALVASGSDADVMPVLTEALKHESEWPRLRALNVLDNMGRSARPAAPQIKQALKLKSRFGYDHRLCKQLLDKLVE